ncbi:MAG: glucoamylase family protein [Syntrophobacteraceae bacterium]|nr:glucoamylase family protein [Syntrophobacteraceae bacterium]
MKQLYIIAILLSIALAAAPKGARAAIETDAPKEKISHGQKEFLDRVERDTFRFFWDTANPRNGLVPDSFPGAKMCSVAGVGFALTSYAVGAKRHFITRARAAERTLKTLDFLFNAPQSANPGGAAGYKGFFYHFLRMDNGFRYEESELSTIDTALLMAGVLSSEAYFDKDNPVEAKIRNRARALYRRVDWPWASSRSSRPLLSMGWTPEKGFIRYDWAGYNEGMILYILAIGSPTHPIEARAWDKWTMTYKWSDFCGYSYVNFGPVFGYQYSHIWVDFRGIRDKYMAAKGIDYFINSRLAVYANQAYCVRNPGKWRGYGDMVWGLSASDGPGKTDVDSVLVPTRFHGYWARGSSSGYTRDDGTISPSAAGGSVAFAPEIAIPTLQYFFQRFGSRLYGRFGFKDAFNLSFGSDSSKSPGWFDSHYLAIDQGPILLMIENYRSGFLWGLMKKNPSIRNGLERAGFSGGWLKPPYKPIIAARVTKAGD